jgi:biopolymer transport protein TolQ
MNTPEIAGAIVEVTPHIDASIFGMIAGSDWISKIVLLILFAASLRAWMIIAQKYSMYKAVAKKMDEFESVFWSGQVLDTIYERVKKSADNPLSSVFVAAMTECKRADGKAMPSDSVLKVGVKERVMQAMNLVRNREAEGLEDNLGFLAMIGSSATFVGLFGTVWGIMNSFQSIAASKNTSLAVVAPGIAEALFATAVGLFAAIPAIVFYNSLVNKVSRITNKLDDFIGELHTILARAIDEEKL